MTGRAGDGSLLASLAGLTARARAGARAGDRQRVPLHQVVIVDGYDTPDPLPPAITRNAQAARAACPGTDYRLWNGHQLRAFIAQRFSRDVIAAFDTLAPYSYKCDLARFCLLHELGGFYVDLGVRLMRPWPIPAGRRVAAFRDLPFITSSWTAMQTGLLWALPGQREFALAIDLIVGNVRARYYGSGPLHPTGPVLLGKAMLAAAVERGWDGQDAQHIGVCRSLTPGASMPNMGYVSPEGSLVALRTKLMPGDVEHLGLTQGNNYNQLWRARRAYGERAWAWHVAGSGTSPSEQRGSARLLRLDPVPVLVEGSYEATWTASDPSSTLEPVRVQSSQGGEDAIEASPAGRTGAEIVTPFVVHRREDAIACAVGAPTGHLAGSLTIREAVARRWSSDDPAIRVSRGVRTPAGMALTGAADGLVSFGPYATVFKGRYRLDVIFTDVGRSGAAITVEICTDLGRRRLASLAVPTSRLAQAGRITLPFHCETDVRNVEFRVFARRRARALLTAFVLTRVE